MGKIAFIFPGQGAQYVGMGKELNDYFPEAKKIFDEADDALGFKISDLCFYGPEDELMKTENTQPAILTMSIAVLRVLEKYDIKADYTAGLSLGEYTSMVYAGAMDFSDAVKLVKKRGKFMQEAVPEGKGKMAALIGISRENAVKLCAYFGQYGVLQCANFNCPGQIVIGGETEAVIKAVEAAKEYGSKKAILLPVSAPFHTSMLKPAADQLGHELEHIKLFDTNIPIIANVNAEPTQTVDVFRKNLKNQVSSSVLWEDSIIKMITLGVDTFVEIGPGSSLCGFVKKIDKTKTFMNIEDQASLEKSLNKLEVGHD
ncbi:MAG: ACP S-malonyltransferase [Dethiosulfatibacter sp.]|nr:ACP S-malonyltransferase [Dethiosulfatibacter sp.]